MSYLIKINEKTNQVLHPEAVKLFPGFNVLSEEEILFIVYAYDYCSPFSAFPEEDRVRRASLQVWADNRLELLTKPKIKNAIEAYKSLQYNPKIELTKAYQDKINEIQIRLLVETSDQKIKAMLESIKNLRASIRELEQEVLAVYEEEGKLIGGGERSFLENMLKNKELYKKVVAKK